MKIQPYLVVFNLPEKLRPLQDLAMNLWFSWNWEAVELFIRLDPEEWTRSYSNPVLMLGRLSKDKLEKAAADNEFVWRLESVHAKLKGYLSEPTWFSTAHGAEGKPLVAYFSMEFGIDQGVPIYSGGLGILAGDHLKSSSDLGIPLVGIGLLYQRGYFQQALSKDGWQIEKYGENDWFNMPVVLERGKDGQPVSITVDVAGSPVKAHIWRVQVGRIPLYLLDANLPDNPPEHRAITANLYGGDRDMRIRQEILLGIGGPRALKALGLNPTAYHMNEGHSAFLALERLRELIVERKMSYPQAREIVQASTVFTTHTPVPAGHEVFAADLVGKYLGSYAGHLGLKWEEFLALGQDEPGKSPVFSLTVLAIRMAAFCNGVARLHGEVSRQMFQHLWPELPLEQVPITHVTNGAHARSWLSHDMGALFEKYLGDGFLHNPADQKLWDKVKEIPDDELWALRTLRRQKLVSVVRKRMQIRLKEQGADATQIREAGYVLDPDALTIGFARRFASYKRANLILRDPERLIKLVTGADRPVQIIFAGKAHPNDNPGKELIKALIHFAQDPRVKGKIVFLEDYDILVARYMVQGVDVWLNNPRRPLEASGTSGMKASFNGALNVSTLDGWWDEGYDPNLGWAIGNGEVYSNPEEGDHIEAEALLNLLEKEVVPTFYKRGKDGLPTDWIRMVKASMSGLGARFNTHRMLLEYAERAYLPAHRGGAKLEADGGSAAKALAEWRVRVAQAWPKVSIASHAERPKSELKVGEKIPLTVVAKLAGLKPDDVAVEAYYGRLNAKGEVDHGQVMRLSSDGASGEEHRFRAEIPCVVGGRHGFAVRVRPSHPDLLNEFTPLYLTWE